MATSGGGIPLAMVAGRIAGEAAIGHLQDRVPLQEYPSRIREEFGRELSRSVQIRKMVDMAMKSDSLMNALFAALNPSQMKSVMRAQIPRLSRPANDQTTIEPDCITWKRIQSSLSGIYKQKRS